VPAINENSSTGQFDYTPQQSKRPSAAGSLNNLLAMSEKSVSFEHINSKLAYFDLFQITLFRISPKQNVKRTNEQPEGGQEKDNPADIVFKTSTSGTAAYLHTFHFQCKSDSTGTR
jgi:hypothetical protein